MSAERYFPNKENTQACRATRVSGDSQFIPIAWFYPYFSVDADKDAEAVSEGQHEQDGETNGHKADGPTIAKMEDVITIDPDCEVLDLNHARIGKIENLEEMVKLERLFLRWNLLKKIENMDHLTKLVELELYDNQITEIENLDSLVNLEWVGNAFLFSWPLLITFTRIYL